MNPIPNNILPISSDITQLREELDTHITSGNSCETFILNYSQTQGIKPEELIQAQLEYTPCFSKMFNHLSNRTEKRFYQKQKLQNISKYAESTCPIEEKETITGELNELKNKMELSKKANKSFQANLTFLIQSNGNAILTEEFQSSGKQSYIDSFSLGRIFFLPESDSSEGPIGECHCHKATDRKARNTFSHYLIDEITKYFPEKKRIEVASIGAGTCFHELEIHTLAQQKGYTISDWTLVDKCLCTKTANNFERLVRCASPDAKVFVSPVKKTAADYFTRLKNSTNKPDVFLFIDVDSIKGPQIKAFAENLDHPSLYASLSKSWPQWATYHDPKAKNNNKESI